MQSKSWRLAIIFLTVCCLPGAFAEDTGDAQLVKDFLASWHSGDIDKIMSYLSEDCYYANHPALGGSDPVIQGYDTIRAFLTPFFRKDPLTVPFKFHTEIDSLVAGGGGVALERRDIFETGNLHHSVPVAGFFRVKNGKINYWVDYFDGGAFQPVTTIMETYARK